MGLPLKQRLLNEINAINDDVLLAKLMAMIAQHESISTKTAIKPKPIKYNKLTEEQRQILQERIDRVEEGKATYMDAKELLEEPLT